MRLQHVSYGARRCRYPAYHDFLRTRCPVFAMVRGKFYGSTSKCVLKGCNAKRRE
jgi:hypothetical protein